MPLLEGSFVAGTMACQRGKIVIKVDPLNLHTNQLSLTQMWIMELLDAKSLG